MQKFPYLSPVRFYPNIDYLLDMKNPENTVFWGKRADIHFLNTYPLEVNTIHRFPVPMNWDGVDSVDELKLYMKTSKGETEIPAIFNLFNDRISCISLKNQNYACGRLVVKNNDVSILISNEVEFIDSSDGLGRKFVTLTSRHSYNINRFPYEDEDCWFHTSIPAYCIGDTSVELELEHNRVGGVSSKRIKETYSDFLTSYEIQAGCDSNILNFIENTARNNHFYIDGIKRTLNEKIERTDKNATGTLKVVNVLDKDGNNILIDETKVFNGIKPFLKKVYYNVNQSPNEDYIEITEDEQPLYIGDGSANAINFSFEFDQPVQVVPGILNIGAVYRNGILFTEIQIYNSDTFDNIKYSNFISTSTFEYDDLIEIEIYPNSFQNGILELVNNIEIQKSLIVTPAFNYRFNYPLS